MATQPASTASVYSATVAYPRRLGEKAGKGGSSVEAVTPERQNGPGAAQGAEQVDIIGAMPLQELPDEMLISKYRAEENTARSRQYVNELFRRHHAKVARWCLSFTGERESAADLAQEICAKAYQHLPSFKGQSRFSTWLFSIARNHCFNAVRAQTSLPAMDQEETIMDTLPDLTSETPHAAAERKQLEQKARQLLNETLDDTERVVFTLHFADELPVDVITRMLNLRNASGAKAFLVSARRKLERAVKRQWKIKA